MAQQQESYKVKLFQRQLEQAREQFVQRGPVQPGAEFRFGSNIVALSGAIDALRLDELLEDPETGVRICGIEVNNTSQHTLLMGALDTHLDELPLVDAMQVLQVSGLPLQEHAYSSIFVGHEAERGEWDLTRPAVQLRSKWEHGRLIDPMGDAVGLRELLWRQFNNESSMRERTAAVADLVKSGEYTLAPPSQEYRMRIGRPVVNHFTGSADNIYYSTVFKSPDYQ